MIPGSANPLLLQSAAAAETGISRSLRFNSSDSAYLSRDITGANKVTNTVSLWVKRSSIGVRNDVVDNLLIFLADDTAVCGLQNGVSGSTILQTTQVFRDPSAWYHFVFVANTSSSTPSERFKVYVNGAQITTFSISSYPTPSANTNFGSVNPQYIGRGTYGGSAYFSGYLADVHFIDGQALDPTSFGEFDATTGVWNPIAYTGSYGTNGFHLDFADNASTTTIGYDAAGSNDWTANNLSVTAGAGNDSLVDVPTNGSQTDTGAGGEVRGNYCTWNPLNNPSGSTLANGNLDYTSFTTTYGTVGGTIAVSSGKWYWEIVKTGGTASPVIGFTPASRYSGSTYPQYAYYSDGSTALKTSDSFATSSSYGATYTTNDVIGVALDLDAGTCTFYKNGASQGQAFTGVSGTFVPAVSDDTNGSSSVVNVTANFGQRPFAYTAPSGFKALCTANLPAPLVTKPSTVMDVVLYTGTGSALTPTSTLGFNPDLVWIKGRSGATDHAWYDAVRGAEKRLESNNADDEVTTDGGVTAFNSNGFTLGTLAQVNTNAATYVAWCWDENVSAGFDIVTYTGNGSARTINHSLGVAPSLIIVKARTTASTNQGWPVYHSANTAAPATDYLLLNDTAATADLDTVWNDTAPTSSVFSVGTSALVNANNDTYVAYCFAPVVGYSSFGSYTGNGSSTDGPFVYTGFRPRWLMIKRATGTAGGSDWIVYDGLRPGYNLNDLFLKPNTSDAEQSGSTNNPVDLLSNGFKLRWSTANSNASGDTFIYAAFAEAPLNYSRAR